MHAKMLALPQRLATPVARKIVGRGGCGTPSEPRPSGPL